MFTTVYTLIIMGCGISGIGNCIQPIDNIASKAECVELSAEYRKQFGGAINASYMCVAKTIAAPVIQQPK